MYFNTILILLIYFGSFLVADDSGKFSITRLQYRGGGDWYADQSSISNLLNFIANNTNIPVDLIEKNAVSDTDVRNLASKIDSLSTTFTSFQYTSTNSFNEIISKIEKMQKDMTEIHRDVKRPTIVKRLF